MDLGWQWHQIAEDVRPEVEDLFERSAFCLGPYVDRFEEAFSNSIGVAHAVAVNSGTSALHLAVLAAGLGPGDKVLVPGNSFIASAWGAVYVGAEPVFCDVVPRTGNIDVSDAERRLDSAVKAIVPVHLYGQVADLDGVRNLAERYGLIVIEDAAQAHGARHGNRHVGGLGDLGCFSFYPGKNLGAAGEAGVVVTDNEVVAERLRSLRNHGQRERYLHDEVGFNYRMDGLQGLVVWHKLQHLDDWTKERKRLAACYLEALSALDLELPDSDASDHVFHLFVVRTPRRDKLRRFLESQGIGTGLHYPVALHHQPCFSHLASAETSLPVAEHYAAQCLSLPLFLGMSDRQQSMVVSAVHRFFEKG
jgi:dTDP-4-amino-4,6-dideoxygalactose transaminase